MPIRHQAKRSLGKCGIKFPAHELACEEDASWGINPDATFDCGNSAQEIKKLVWGGVRDKWPAAHRFLRNVRITNKIQNAMVVKIDVEGQKIEDVVAEWIDKNEDTWSWWIKDALRNPGM